MNGEEHVTGGFGSAPADPAAAAANSNAVAEAIASAGVNTGNAGGGVNVGQRVAPDSQVFYVDNVHVLALKMQQAKLQQQCDAVKVMARDAEKKAEIAKHKSPQIKRSVDFLLEAKFDITDAKELIEKAVSGDGELFDVLSSLSIKLDSIDNKVDAELLANRIASKANFGWKTVKCFETDSLFQGPDAEALTKKFKQAEFQAAKSSFRGRRGGRGGYPRANFHPYQAANARSDGRYPPVRAAFGPPSATVTSSTGGGSKPCYGCGLEGHQIKFCPTKK